MTGGVRFPTGRQDDPDNLALVADDKFEIQVNMFPNDPLALQVHFKSSCRAMPIGRALALA